jgi:putative transposase
LRPCIDNSNKSGEKVPRSNRKKVKPENYEAFEQILAEGLTRYACRILAYQLMPNHWHFVLQPTEDGGMSYFLW